MTLIDTDNDNDNPSFIRSLFLGARKPIDAIVRSSKLNPYRSAQVQAFPGVSNEEVAVLNSPLSNSQKMMLEDIFISDPVVRRALSIFTKFLLGRRTKTTVDINKEFMTPEAQEQALATTFNESEINELKTMIDKVNRQVKLQEKLEAAVVQTMVGGRAALLIEKQGEMPIDLKILNWGKLGRVFADKDTWKMLAVEYADRPKDKPLLAEELLYFTWQDYHVTPDTLYHGNSAILPISDMAETIRLIVSEDMKEVTRAMWANSGMIKFPPNTSQTKMAELLANYMPGTWNATSQAVEITTHDLNPKIKEMTELVKEWYRIIAQGLGIPEFLLNSDEVPNRAVADIAMNAWRESDLNHARTWLQGILEPQWFDALVQLRFPDVDTTDMRIKAKLEFEDVTFETLKDKVDAVIPLWQARLITPEKLLTMIDMDDIKEQVLAQLHQQELEAQRQKEQQIEQFRQNVLQQQQQQQSPQNDGIDKDPTKGTAELMQKIRRQEQQIGELQQRRGSLADEMKLLQAALASAQQQQQQSKPQQPRDDTKRRLAEAEHKVKMELLEKQRDLIERMNLRIAKYEGRATDY